MNTLKDDLRPLQPTRGRSIQGVRGNLEAALSRPQCLVFGLPTHRPTGAGGAVTPRWNDRGYSWGYRGGPIEDDLTLKTLTAIPRQPFKSVRIALDLFPLYATTYYESAEPFEDTYKKGVLGDYAVEIYLRQGMAQIGYHSESGELQYCPTNPLSESHLLRTLSWQCFTMSTKVYGEELAYKEGTHDPVRDRLTKHLKLRPEVEIDQALYDPLLPMDVEIVISSKGQISWADGANTANLYHDFASPTLPAHERCMIWITAFSAWGHQ